jgi:hypothetical protein
MQRKRLPIGIQTFSEIRDKRENLAYVDKTAMALDLIERSKYCFLSRPRRFGKSLFLDTLAEIFKGSKALFEGLHIYDKWDWQQQYPVIQITFASGDMSGGSSIRDNIKDILHSNAKDLDVLFEMPKTEDMGLLLRNFLAKVSNAYGQRVVVLIDEYDKPILDNIHKEDKTVAREAREILRNFYGAIKAADRYLRFVFITGVSKFSKLNLFSGLNNLQDITLHSSYSTITGYTQGDLEEVFGEYLEGIDLPMVSRWYNGYNYLGEAVYNPYDILLFLSNNGVFRNYWWETGNPSFLIELLRKSNYYIPHLENVVIAEEDLSAFDVERIDMVALLWQTGYLTFEERIELMHRVSYRMKLPNLEVQNSLNTLFFDYLTNIEEGRTSLQLRASRALLDGNLEELEKALRALFASIPYQNYVNSTISNYEGYYASVVFTFLSGMGYEVKAEDTTNRGRIDMTMIGRDRIYIIEFKVDKAEEEALAQIKIRKYYEKYLSEQKTICLLGIHFDSSQRNISGFAFAEIRSAGLF